MFAKRMNALIRMQLVDGRKFRNMSNKKIIVYFLLRILTVALITVVASAIMYVFQNLMFLDVNQNLLLFFIGIVLIISTIGNTDRKSVV